MAPGRTGAFCPRLDRCAGMGFLCCTDCGRSAQFPLFWFAPDGAVSGGCGNRWSGCVSNGQVISTAFSELRNQSPREVRKGTGLHLMRVPSRARTYIKQGQSVLVAFVAATESVCEFAVDERRR